MIELREANDVPVHAAENLSICLSQGAGENDLGYAGRMLGLVARLLSGRRRAEVEDRLCRLTEFQVDRQEDQFAARAMPVIEVLLERQKLHHEWHQRHTAEGNGRVLLGTAQRLDWERLLYHRSGCSAAMYHHAKAMCERYYPPGQITEWQMRDWAGAVGRAPVLQWDDRIWEAATAGAGSFENESMRDGWVPGRPVLWFWESLKVVSTPHWYEDYGIDRGSGLLCTLIAPALLSATVLSEPPRSGETMAGERGFTAWEFWISPNSDMLPFVRAVSCPVGEPITLQLRDYLAASRFLSLPFVTEHPAPQTRQVRRAYERKHGEPPPVSVVVLRKPAHAHAHPTGGHREFDCHFLVRDHWRKRAPQWHHGDGPIYVHAHIKGNPDKPFRVPRDTVYLAKR